jgi:hypothetical protein
LKLLVITSSTPFGALEKKLFFERGRGPLGGKEKKKISARNMVHQGHVERGAQVLAELKHVLKQDDGMELNVSKTSILPKVVTTPRLTLMWYRTSHKLPSHCRLTSVGTFSSRLSFLKVSLVSVIL